MNAKERRKAKRRLAREVNQRPAASNQSVEPIFGSSFGSPEAAAVGSLFGPAAGAGGLFGSPEPAEEYFVVRTQGPWDHGCYSRQPMSQRDKEANTSRRVSGPFGSEADANVKALQLRCSECSLLLLC